MRRQTSETCQNFIPRLSSAGRILVAAWIVALVALLLVAPARPAQARGISSTANTPPTISTIANQSIDEDTSIGPLAFTIGDAETAASQLQLFFSSSNTLLLPGDRIVLGGSGANRTITLTPTAERSGSVLVTIIVSDGAVTAQTSFMLTVSPVDDPPTISGLQDQTIENGLTLGPLGVTINDVDTALNDLQLSVATSDAMLLPPSTLVLGGSDGARTVAITADSGLTGSAAITLTVSDGTSTASSYFTLTVVPRNQAPTVSVIADQQMNEDSTKNIPFVATDPETASNDLIYTASSSNQTIVPNLNLSLGGSGHNRLLSITPAPDQFGSVIITVSVNDGEYTITRSFSLTILAVNDPPTIVAIGSQVTLEDTPIQLSLTITDVDTPLGQITIVGSSTNQQLVPDRNVVVRVVGNSRSVLITPMANQFGSTVIVLTIGDGANFVVATFQLTVVSVNDPPVVVPFANQRVNEDVTFGPYTFIVQDVESPATALTTTATAANTALITATNIVVTGNDISRSITITPTANAYGASFVTIWVGDGEDVGSFTFTLNVDPVNDRPEMDDLPDVSTLEDTPVTISFGARDVETPFKQLIYSAQTSNRLLLPQGSFQFSTTNTENLLRMTPAPDLFGTAIVSVTVSDGQLIVTKSFTLTVESVNDAPTISTPVNLTTPQGISTTVSFNVADRDTALNLLILTVSSSNDALFPGGSMRLGGSGSARSVLLLPAPSVYGIANITVLVDDGTDRASMTFKVTVLAPPEISTIVNQSTDEDIALTVAFTVSDQDTDLNTLRLTATSSNNVLVPLTKITFAGSGNARTVTILPAANLYGTARLTVTVSDATLSASTSFTLTVISVNDAPTIATIPAQLIDQDAAGSVTISLADVDNAPESLVLSATSSEPFMIPNASLVSTGTGATRSLRFAAIDGRYGTATITVRVSDGGAESSTSFVVTVNGAPSIVGLSDVTVAEDSIETINFTVADPDTDPTRLKLIVSSGDTVLMRTEKLILAGSGSARSLKIQPEPNRFGVTTITLSVDDGRLRTTYLFQVTVLPVNDAPTIGTIAPQLIDEDTTNGPVAFGVDDIDTPVDSLQLFGSSSNTTLLPLTGIVFGGAGGNRTISLTPAPNLYGSVMVTVTVSDGSLHASTRYTLTVLPVNDAPMIAPIAAQNTPEDTPITVTFQVGDVDSPFESLTVSARSSQQALVKDSRLQVGGSGAERTVMITPELDQAGTTTITLRVSDGGLTSERAFVLTVDGVNDSPTLEAIGDQAMDEDSILAVDLFVNDIDTSIEKIQVTVESGDLRIVSATGVWIEGLGLQRTLRIQPAKDRNGSLSVTLTASDGEFSVSRSFRLTIRPVNDPPVAVDDHVRISSTPSFNIGVLANDWDVDRDPLQVVSVSPGVYGAISINSDNTLRYLMPADFIGTEVVDYTIDDGHGQRASARLTIVVVNAGGEGTAAIHAIEPRQWDNDRSVQIVISGVRFSGPAQASLGPYPLLDVQVQDDKLIRATIPAFLPPGRYDLIVKLANGDTLIRRAEFVVTTSGVAVTGVRPNRSVQAVPQLVNVYGINFAAQSLVLLDDQPLETRYLSSTHLQVMVPANAAPPGIYPITVRRPDGLQATQANAFTIYAENSEDLFAFPFELWTDPGTLHTGQSVLIGIDVHRQSDGKVLLDVPVAFYSGEPSEQTYLGRTLIPVLEANERTSTRPLTWTPPAPGSYTLYAVIDPDNRLPEINEENNVINRSITVLPTAVDMIAPTVTELVVQGRISTTDSAETSVQVGAHDADSGVRAIYLIEYEYAQSAGRWTPVQWSGWLDYTGTPMVYPWKLLPSPGVRYLYAWAADNAGNISDHPQIMLINYAHAKDDILEAGETRLFRYYLQKGEQMLAFVIPGQGDPDLYIWPPDHQTRGPWVTNLQNTVDEIGFIAPVSGVYQMEVTAFTPTVYSTVVEVRSGGPRLAPATSSNLDPTKPLRGKPYVPVAYAPFGRYALPLGPLPDPIIPPISNPPPPRPPEILLFLPGVQN